MTRDQFSDLLSWSMLSALNSAVIVAQNQMQRPLTPEEIEDCQTAGAALVEGIKENYLAGVESRRLFDEARNRTPRGKQ